MLFLILLLASGVDSQRFVIPPYIPVQYPVEDWPNCRLPSGSNGLCQKIVDCPNAIRAINLGLHPPICYWEKHLLFPLVCCPLQEDNFQSLSPAAGQDDFSGIAQSRFTCGRIKTTVDSSIYNYNEDLRESPLNGQRGFDGREKYPWMVSVYMDNEGKDFLYSGFLIDSNHVLTSAQGLKDASDQVPYVVRLGGPKENGPLYEVGRCKVHGGYRTWVKYDDIAILRLKDPVVDAHVPICLPNPEMKADALAGMNATVTGFSKVDKIAIVNQDWCKEVYSKFSPLTYPRGVSNQFICAGLQLQEKPLPHQTDIGAPLALQDENGRWTAVGLVSYDYKDAAQGFPGVYINLAHYSSWIEKERTRSHYTL